MAKLKWKGGALVAPVPPAMISCMGADGKPNILTIAWTGILCTHPPKTYISVRPSRHSYPIIKESGEFVINLTTKELVRAADFCGMKTGKKVDKFKECKLTPDFDEKFEDFSCPAIAESPMSIYCSSPTSWASAWTKSFSMPRASFVWTKQDLPPSHTANTLSSAKNSAFSVFPLPKRKNSRQRKNDR